MIRLHADAAKALLETSPGLVVYDGETPDDPADRYVLLFLTTPQRLTRRLSADAPKVRFLLSTMSVGLSANECRWVVEHVHAALIRNRLIVAGRLCDPFLPPESPAQIRPDNSIHPPAFVATDVWAFNSSPVS